MKNKLFHNWILKLTSLFLAATIWILIIQIEDPTDSKSFGNITVNLTNTELLDAENKVYEVLEDTDTVKVTVRAPRSVVTEIRSSDIIAEADMSKLTDINTIAITYYIQNADDESVEITGNHDVVKLSVEDKASKYVSLRYNIVGEVEDGYILGNITLDQNMLEISGPKSAVETVSAAKVDINVEGASSSLSANMEIKLYDKDGNVITQENIDKQTDYAKVSVEVLATKEVPIEIDYEGEPANGYMTTGVVEASPSTVKIAGSSSALSNVSSISIPAEAVDITDAEENVVQTVDISDYITGNVKLADSDFDGEVEVTVYIEPVVDRSLMIAASNISFTNIPEGFEAILIDDTEEYELQVKGLGDMVNSLQESEIKGVIDISEWMEEQDISALSQGSYYMSAGITLDEDIVIAEDVVVHVQIRAAED